MVDAIISHTTTSPWGIVHGDVVVLMNYGD
jgi:hypothetical protein